MRKRTNDFVGTIWRAINAINFIVTGNIQTDKRNATCV